MNTTQNKNTDEAVSQERINHRPGSFESFGVLAAVLAQAATVPTWTEHSVSRAGFDWTGEISLNIRDEDTAADLAGLLGLDETARIAEPYARGTDEGQLWHRIDWDGVYAGHQVRVWVGWFTDLPIDSEIDRGEGREAQA
jgi:hypothetical protein